MLVSVIFPGGKNLAKDLAARTVWVVANSGKGGMTVPNMKMT
jgi:hypothetical protein